MKNVYLDNAATTQVRAAVIVKMQEALTNSYGNPSSSHSYGRSSKTAIEKARKTIAKTLNAQPSEIIFTSGGTEADNMILRSAVRDLSVKTIITSRIEHHAVLHTVEELQKEFGINVRYVALDEYGNPNLSDLEAKLKEDESKKLVSLMHVNNEIGNIIDLKAIHKLCNENGALLHSDTVQSIGHFKWDVKEIAADFLTAAAHKFHGPKGIGFAFIRKNSGLKPILSGGAQERGFRAGTESMHNIVGLEEAFLISYANLEREKEEVGQLKAYFVNTIKSEIPGIKFNGYSGDLEKSTYTLVNVQLPIEGDKAKMLLFHLDINGIACSEGSACQSGSNLGSHVLTQILTTEALKKPSLRFSFSFYNTREEIDYTIKVLKEFVDK